MNYQITRLPNYPITRSPNTALEQEPQTELDVAAIVGLRRHAAEVRVGRIRETGAAAGEGAGLWVAKIRMVREIEDLRAELHVARAGEADVLKPRDVPLLLAWVVQQIAWGIAERPRLRRRECGRVEPEIVVQPCAFRVLRLRVRVRITDQVVGLTERAVADARDVIGPEHRERRAGAQERRAGNLPAAEHLLERRGLVAGGRHVVEGVGREHLPANVARRAPVAARGVRGGHDVAVCAAIVHPLG